MGNGSELDQGQWGTTQAVARASVDHPHVVKWRVNKSVDAWGMGVIKARVSRCGHATVGRGCGGIKGRRAWVRVYGQLSCTCGGL